ncbi:MAG: hypothetical protein WDM90_08210 [Ferruginibacter sp.]
MKQISEIGSYQFEFGEAYSESYFAVGKYSAFSAPLRATLAFFRVNLCTEPVEVCGKLLFCRRQKAFSTPKKLFGKAKIAFFCTSLQLFAAIYSPWASYPKIPTIQYHIAFAQKISG